MVSVSTRTLEKMKTENQKVGAMAQWIKPAMPASLMGTGSVPAVLSVQVPANAQGKAAVDGPST